MQYFGEYVLGWRGPANMKADKGTIVHKVMEILAEAKVCHSKGEKVLEDEMCGELNIHSSDVITDEDVKSITDIVYDYYSERTPHDWQPKDRKECHKWVWKAIEFKNRAYDPRLTDIVEPEVKFDIIIDKPWAHYKYDNPNGGPPIEGNLALKGTIDQISRIDDTTYEILDYKTGRRLNWATGEEKTIDKLHNDPQLRMYHYAAHKLYPHVDQIIVTIYFINDGGPFSLFFSKDDFPQTEEMLKQKFEHIKKTQIPEKNVSWKCRKFCHLGKSTFEGTHVQPIKARTKGHITYPGQIMSKCEQIDYVIKHRDMDTVVEHMSAENHSVDKYKAPGKIE